MTAEKRVICADKTEKRVKRRIAGESASYACVQTPQGTLHGWVVDFSVGGLGIRSLSKMPLEIGSTAQVTVPGFKETDALQFSGTVCHSDGFRHGVEFQMVPWPIGS